MLIRRRTFSGFCMVELKVRRRKSGEKNLPELAAEIERLMQTVFPTHPTEVQNTITDDYFIDDIKYEETWKELSVLQVLEQIWKLIFYVSSSLK
ncbi:hypothetical protein TNCT_667701 [Trichonephila clavata]|uniref:Uncharacterized protein n=1 Tax=Trichonephila clavata TaxID=2740835 RepID=A0A8X6FUC1_TRICU|nr:hypothetical protein TNCT_667701 [Trichonephila clavata]